MPESSNVTERSLRILHVFRSPVGGLFRHVMDVAAEQVRQGHEVGLVVDQRTGSARADELLAAIKPGLALGLTRFPMHRDPHPSDAVGLLRVAAVTRAMRPDILHGHGSKGALYARLAGLVPFAGPPAVRVYTPHGGSLHFAPGSLKGSLVIGTERLLARRSDLVLFESAYAARRFRETVGVPGGLSRVVLNGLAPHELEPVDERPDAADILFVGELRLLKGVDVLLRAFAGLAAAGGRLPTALIVGAGPDRAAFEDLARELGLGNRVRFAGPLPAREAFAMGRVLVVPSRAESLPYIVLEAGGARRPLIATEVGGIPEILGPRSDRLVAPDDVAALREAMAHLLAQSSGERAAAAATLAARVATSFSVTHMVEGIMGGYREALAFRGRDHDPVRPAVLQTSRFGS